MLGIRSLCFLLLLLLLLYELCWKRYARELPCMRLQELWCWLKALLCHEAADSSAWLGTRELSRVPVSDTTNTRMSCSRQLPANQWLTHTQRAAYQLTSIRMLGLRPHLRVRAAPCCWSSSPPAQLLAR